MFQATQLANSPFSNADDDDDDEPVAREKLGELEWKGIGHDLLEGKLALLLTTRDLYLLGPKATTS
jgi:hypothetical protein